MLIAKCTSVVLTVLCKLDNSAWAKYSPPSLKNYFGQGCQSPVKKGPETKIWAGYLMTPNTDILILIATIFTDESLINLNIFNSNEHAHSVRPTRVTLHSFSPG